MRDRRRWRRRWLRHHVIAAPIGIGLITAGLAWLGRTEVAEQTASVTYLKTAASMAYLSTVAYAFIAALVEGGISMGLWALDERRERIERAKDEGRAEAAKEYKKRLEQVVAQATASAVQEAEERREKALAAARERARADGVDLDKYLNP